MNVPIAHAINMQYVMITGDHIHVIVKLDGQVLDMFAKTLMNVSMLPVIYLQIAKTQRAPLLVLVIMVLGEMDSIVVILTSVSLDFATRIRTAIILKDHINAVVRVVSLVMAQHA